MLPKAKEVFLKERQNQEELCIKCKVSVDGYTDFIFINRFCGVQHQGTLSLRTTLTLKRVYRLV